MTLKNNRAPHWCYVKLCASFQSHRWIQSEVTVRKRSIRVKIDNFFVPCDLEIWWMTLKNKRAPLLCCFKLYASFHSHQWIQTKVAVRKRPMRVKIRDFFCAVWPWNLTDDLGKQKGTSFMLLQALCIISKPSVNWNWSYSPETLNSGQNWRFFVPCDLEIWRMTLKNNRAPLLCYFKLCASFCSHWWIQPGVAVWKRSIRVKISNFLSSVTLKFDGSPWKTIGHLS